MICDIVLADRISTGGAPYPDDTASVAETAGEAWAMPSGLEGLA